MKSDAAVCRAARELPLLACGAGSGGRALGPARGNQGRMHLLDHRIGAGRLGVCAQQPQGPTHLGAFVEAFTAPDQVRDVGIGECLFDRG